MSTIKDDLQSFTYFVTQKIQSNSDLELPELFDLWMMQNPNHDDYAQDVAAVNASIANFLDGKHGTPAREHSQQMREKFGFVNE